MPRVIFGSSALGNLYGVVPDESKRAIVNGWMEHQRRPVFIDSAGKYGAGLALETLGRLLHDSGVEPDDVVISNKLGWRRVPLTTDEPTFEPGAWFGLEHDATQAIDGEGILECWKQGNELLGGYRADLLSVHDPDDYIAAGKDEADAQRRYDDVVDAYRALVELRERGQARSIGIGAKDWRIAQRLLADDIQLDWVMIANVFTVMTHPPEVLALLDDLRQRNIAIINAGVFNAGFLTGGRYFDYVEVDRASRPGLFDWREQFNALCERFGVTPAHACCQFAFTPPGVASIALNTSRPGRIPENLRIAEEPMPTGFWAAMKAEGLLSADYPHAGDDA
ncbi:MAG: aldo/keto reductase [Planctomycetota bacterium]